MSHSYYFILLLFLLNDSLAENNSYTAFNCRPQQPKIGLILNTSLDKVERGCQIKQIIPLSTAWYSALRVTDWIGSINQIDLKNQKSPCQLLSQEISSSTLDIVELEITPDLAIMNQPKQNIRLDRTQKTKLMGNLYDNLLISKSLNCLSLISDMPVLPYIQKIQKSPASLESELEKIQYKVDHAELSLASLSQILPSLNHNIKVRENTHLSINSFKQLSQILKQKYQLTQQAFKKITQAEMQFFLSHFDVLSQAIEHSQQLINVIDRGKLETLAKLFEMAAKVDYGQLFNASQSWYELAQYPWPKKLFHPHKVVYPTAYGTIIFGTYGDDSYYLNDLNYSIIVDPGGNDRYIKNNQLSEKKVKHIFNQAIIDLSGNDSYLSLDNSGIASAIMGVSLLIDKQGNDMYRGKTWAQASAFAGASALYDLSGNDSYQADSFSQASALFGSSSLIDKKGNDSYQIRHHGQGLGLAYGYGLLLDQQGNDSYLSRDGLPSSYVDTPLSRESWSQGVGKGFRYILPGGVGFLVDKKGNNSFKAGEFAQGSGYYFGIGLLFNLGIGNDSYSGSRYNLGSAAHQAIAAFIETGGNDRYITSGPAFCGSGWDQSITYFNDLKGNDSYHSLDFSFGATHNSIAIFKKSSGYSQFFNTQK